MKISSFFLAFTLVAGMTAVQADTPVSVGALNLEVPAPGRRGPLAVTVWYPAAKGGTPALVGDNAVFLGTPVNLDAPVARGSFPVILLSHGGLRSAPNLGNWIARDLASHGYIVAALRPDDPGSRTAQEAISDIWNRPAYMSAALTAIEQDPALTGHVNGGNVGALGFFLGGTSVLSLAGGRMDAALFATSCERRGGGPDCAWYKSSGLDLHEVNADRLERSNLDPRIKVVVAVNPELASTFTRESLSGISVPTQIISLGQDDAVPPWLQAADLSRHIPRARHDTVADATHFDAFSECKAAGLSILQEEGEGETPCDTGRQPRAEVHSILATIIESTFREHLDADR